MLDNDHMVAYQPNKKTPLTVSLLGWHVAASCIKFAITTSFARLAMLEGVTQAANLESDSLGFWATLQLIEQTRRIVGAIPSSEHVCEAVREKSEREGMPQPGYPYRHLAGQSAMLADEFDHAAGDGL